LVRFFKKEHTSFLHQKDQPPVPGSTITTTVTATVILGAGHYPSPLTVTGSGVVMPFLYGTNGVYGTQGTDTLTSAGMISGAPGGYRTTGDGIAGGIGVDLTHGGLVLDTGTIRGGLGGSSNLYGCGAGGIGMDIAGGKLSSSGIIEGGAGGASTAGTTGGAGGLGVLATGATLVMDNSGLISGGAGGSCNRTGPAGTGGAGVELGDGRLMNTGSILGGAGGQTGGVTLLAESGQGGAGVDLAGAGTLTNAGTITAGQGGNSRYGPAAGGGAGVAVQAGGKLVNHAVITGGAGAGYSGKDAPGSAGGAGVLASGHDMIVNTGTIAGGQGGVSVSLDQYAAGTGGAGIDLSGAGTITNQGTILGGAGGVGDAYRCAGGTGGDGLDAAIGGVLINNGVIIGGAGGEPDHAAYGANGSGVYLDGGTLIDTGTIAGGQNATGALGDAVRFGSIASTLIVHAGVVFDGAVAANSAVHDELLLEGHSPGTLSGFGETITGFDRIVAAADAVWTLNGTVAGAGQVQIGGGVSLTLTGTVGIASILFDSAGRETLVLGNPLAATSAFSGFAAHDGILLDNVLATSFSFAHEVLTLYAADGLVADRLVFHGDYDASNFRLKIEGPDTLVYYSSKVQPALMGTLDLTRQHG
jgi:hypothetical protein